MFNSLFSLVKKFNYSPFLFHYTNIWFLANSSIFYYKLQNSIYVFITVMDFLKLKIIKINILNLFNFEYFVFNFIKISFIVIIYILL